MSFPLPRRPLPVGNPALLATAIAPACLFGATLFAGGVVAWRNPLMRPPRLPDSRPPDWLLPSIGAGWMGATGMAAMSPATVARVALPALAAPGWCLAGFELARTLIAWRKTGPADIIMVLGCALIGDQPSDMLERRLRRAVAVAKRGREPGNTRWDQQQAAHARDEQAATQADLRVVCCGGVGDAYEDGQLPPSEAEVMAHWLREYLPRELAERAVIIEEDASASTVENIANAIDILGRVPADTRVTVVTSDFHVLRVGQTIRHHDFDKRLGASDWQVEGAWTPWKYWATSTLREFLAQPVVWGSSFWREVRRLLN